MFLSIIYKLKLIKQIAHISLNSVDVIMKLNNNPTPIPDILPKLIRLNFKGLKSSGFNSRKFIVTPSPLLSVLSLEGMDSEFQWLSVTVQR